MRVYDLSSAWLLIYFDENSESQQRRILDAKGYPKAEDSIVACMAGVWMMIEVIFAKVRECGQRTDEAAVMSSIGGIWRSCIFQEEGDTKCICGI